MTDIPATKCCTICGEPYPATLEFFPPDKQMRYGLHSWCRVCFRARSKEYQREYYKKNKDKKNEYQREYYKKNKDKIKEYYEKNKDKKKEYQREYSREYYQKNREWILEKEREKRGSKKIDDDDDIDYSDLYPLDERSFGFRSWAVITSAEYAKELTAWQIADMMEEETED